MVIFTITIIVKRRSKAKKIRMGAGEGSNRIAKGVGSVSAKGSGSASIKGARMAVVPEKIHIGVFRAISWFGQIARK